MLRIATDEAGYGPLLGPLVIAAAAARGGAAAPWAEDTNLGDSKRIYARGGRAALARSLAPYLPHEHAPLRLGDLLERCSLDGDPRAAYAWYAGEVLDREAAPRATPRGFERLWVHPVCEREFNAGCRALQSKASVLFEGTIRLVRAALEAFPGEPAEVLCDKHGGRNRYAALLLNGLDATSLAVIREGREESAYLLEVGGRPVRIAFRARADATEPLCGLASMAAKYVRELFMESFNRWFAARVEGLRPTAGYHGDGQRFLRDLEAGWPDLPRHRAGLVRER